MHPAFKNDEELCKYAIDLYNAGMLKKEIAEALNINQRTLYKKLKVFGFSIYKKRSKGLTPDEQKFIADLYTSGSTIKEIVYKVGCTIHDVRKALTKYDIEPNTSKFYRERYINKNSFIDYTEEEFAYFYGWIVSDGCLSANGSIILSLNSKDIEILHSLKQYVGGNRKVSSYTSSPDPRTGAVYETSSFSFQDEDICSRLVKLGLEERKSTKEVCPEVFKLNRHFWRGMFEGDGCISKTSNNIDLVGSEEIVNDFSAYIKHVCPESKPRFYKKGSISVVSLCSRVYSKQILDELYRDCKYKLSRKYNIYLEKYYGA